MPTTVKIDPKFKKEIDKLQAKVTMKTGEKITQQDLLVRIIQFVLTNQSNQIALELLNTLQTPFS